VISSAFPCEFASSWHLGEHWLRDSCFSWWLPSPRRLGAMEEVRHELVIVRGRLRQIVRGFAPSSAKSHKVALVNCSCHWVTSLAVGSCGALRELGCGLPISRRTTYWWSTQWGLACRQAYELREKILVSLVHLVIDCLPVIGLHWIYLWWLACYSTRQYKHHPFTFTFPQVILFLLLCSSCLA
jgi:hypothetical protein